MNTRYDLQIPLLKLSHHGGTRVLVELANHAAAAGYRVRLLYPVGRVEKNYQFHAALTVTSLACGVRWGGLDYLIYLLRLPFLLQSGTLLANFFVTFYPVWVAHKIFRRPYLYLVQDLETWFQGRAGTVLNAICRLTWRSSRKIAVSKTLAQSLAEAGFPVMQTIQVGVAEKFFTSPVVENEKLYDLIYFPRSEGWKRLDRLPRLMGLAAAKQRPLKILCVAQDEAILQQCATWGCATQNPAHEAQLIAAYDSAKILLFTSDREGLGLPPLEGMARGLPAIVYDNAGIRSYMQHGSNGSIIQDGQDEQAVHDILTLLDDRSLWQRQSDAARQTAEQFRMSHAFNALLQLIPKQT